MTAWAATKAKAQFSEVLDKAESEGPQLVTRRQQEFYVMTREQKEAEETPLAEKPFVSAWDALRPSFEERFEADFPRLRSRTRKVNLE